MQSKKKSNFSLIGIHATILSIVITFLSAYGLFVFEKLDEIEYQAFSEYLKINDVYLASTYKSPRHQFPYLLNIPCNLRYKKIVENFWRLASDDLINSSNKNKPTEKEIAENGFDLICNMTVLQNMYPYPTRISFNKEGEVIFNNKIQKLKFNSIDELRNWINDIDEILRVTLFFYSQRKGKLDELILAAMSAAEKKFPPFESEEELDNKYTPGEKNDLLKMKKSIVYISASEFFRNMEKTQKIFIDTKKMIDDYDLYKNRHINKDIFAIGLILTFIAFITSVIIPMLINISYRIFEVWIPVATYLIIFSYLLLKLLLL